MANQPTLANLQVRKAGKAKRARAPAKRPHLEGALKVFPGLLFNLILNSLKFTTLPWSGGALRFTCLPDLPIGEVDALALP
jgi:hypothetical protein